MRRPVRGRYPPGFLPLLWADPVHGEIAVHRGELYFESEGEGHPVVLIHAGIVDRRMWDRQFHLLAKRFHTVRYDVRGFGRSSRPVGPYSDSSDLEALLRHLDIDRPMLVGVSTGGRIALDFAVEHRDSVEALVPVCSAVRGYDPSSDPEASAAFQTLGERVKRVENLYRKGQLEAAVDDLLSLWTPALTGEARSLVRRMVTENAASAFTDEELSAPLIPSTASRLGELSMPTLVIEGERDQPAMHYVADFIADGIPGSSRASIAGADHLPNLSRPEEFERLLLPFLE